MLRVAYSTVLSQCVIVPTGGGVYTKGGRVAGELQRRCSLQVPVPGGVAAGDRGDHELH